MRQTRAAAVLVALTMFVLTLAAHSPAEAATTMAATKTVNVRSAPKTSAKIVGGLTKGQTVTAVKRKKKWTKVRFKGKKAYVATRYLKKVKKAPAAKPTTSGTVRVATTALNLRTGPGLSYAKIVVLPAQTQVTLTGKASRGYVEVVAGARRGWVSSQYLAAAGLPAVTGTRVTTADLLIRTTSGKDSKSVGEIKKGSTVSITGAIQNGRAQIIHTGAVRWVTAKYLANPVTNQPTVPGLPTIVGTRYATAALLIRSSSSADYTVISEVPKGTQLSITGVVLNKRAQIVYANAVRWVTAKYLSVSPPAAGGASGSVYAVEKGLKPNAIKVHRAVRATFPEITTIYGVRRDPIPDHPSGLALDLMIPSYNTATGRALGQRVALWAKANHASLGINYVIWDQRIWNIQRDQEGWRYMADRGGDSANHKNHVHITVFR